MPDASSIVVGRSSIVEGLRAASGQRRGKATSYRDLDVWKKGMEIVEFVYELTEKFPQQERFGLAAQMQRSAISIPSNIAEGFARQHKKEYQQFCYVALGSCAELGTQVTIGERRRYLSMDDARRSEELLDHESKMLMSLIKRLRA